MKNKFIVEGLVEKVVFKNVQVSKYEVTCIGKSETKKCHITSFSKEHMQIIEDFVGDGLEHEFSCIIYNSNYQDKKTKEWINNVTAQIKEIIK